MRCTILYIGTPQNLSLGIRGVHSAYPPLSILAGLGPRHHFFHPLTAAIQSLEVPKNLSEMIQGDLGISGDGLDHFYQLPASSHNLNDLTC